MKLVRLAIKINAAVWPKTVLLTTLVAIATLVFLGVQELSRASSEDLDEAMASDLGTLGSYRIELSPDLGLTISQSLALVHEAVDPLGWQDLQLAVELPALHPECPPFRQLGTLSVAVLMDASGRPLPFDGSTGLPVNSDLCLAGLVIPRDALREPTDQEAKLYGANLFLDPDFESEARLISTDPVHLSIGIVTRRAADDTAALNARLAATFADAAAIAGLSGDEATTVIRADDGLQVRSAANGIKLVYGLIGWGVLTIGGLGLLVAELIVLRDRNWFFGLARAVGARKNAVAGLIAMDIAIVLLAGLGLAVVTALIAAPAIDAFGRASFQTGLQLVRPSGLVPLAAGGLVMLLLGAAYPAWRVTRLDPLEVLERR